MERTMQQVPTSLGTRFAAVAASMAMIAGGTVAAVLVGWRPAVAVSAEIECDDAPPPLDAQAMEDKFKKKMDGRVVPRDL